MAMAVTAVRSGVAPLQPFLKGAVPTAFPKADGETRRMASTQADAARNDRRSRIVQAAAQMFATRAYAEVQMDDLAKAADVAKPTIYRYFRSKEELFLEVLDGAMSALVTEVTQVAGGTGPSPLILRRMAEVTLDAITRCVASIQALDGCDSDLGERGPTMLRHRARLIRGAFADVLRRGVAEGAFRPLDAEIVSGAILGAVRMAANLEESPSGRASLDTLIDLLLNGLATRPIVQRM